MTTFEDARAFLLKHRTDYDTAFAGFEWPAPAPFNWALDWFDKGLAQNPEHRDRNALWIVDVATGNDTKLTFADMSRRSNRTANFLRDLGLKRGDRLLLLLGNVAPLWETMLAAMKLGVVVIPATTLLTQENCATGWIAAAPRRWWRPPTRFRNSRGWAAAILCASLSAGAGIRHGAHMRTATNIPTHSRRTA